MNRGIIAAALSAVLPGAGQLYNHHWIKGVSFMIPVMIISGVVRKRELFVDASPAIAVVIALAILGVAVFSVADAYRSAKKA